MDKIDWLSVSYGERGYVDQSMTSKYQPIPCIKNAPNEKYGDKYLIISNLYPYFF